MRSMNNFPVGLPSYGLYVILYEHIKRLFEDENSHKAKFWAGGLTGIVKDRTWNAIYNSINTILMSEQLVITGLLLDLYRRTVDRYTKLPFLIQGPSFFRIICDPLRDLYQSVCRSKVPLCHVLGGRNDRFGSYQGWVKANGFVCVVFLLHLLLYGRRGVISWLSIIYLDVVKTRIQADDPLNPKYKGMMDCFRQSYREGGSRIFTRGMLAMSLRAFPLNGGTFLGYEYCLAACRKLHLENEDEETS